MEGLASAFVPKGSAHHQLCNKTHFFSEPKKSSFRWGKRLAVSATGEKKKVVVVMGPTGCGKSKLSVELSSRFFRPSEIINSDKIQMYRDLDITTNKIPINERNNVPHHLIGDFDSAKDHPEFTPSDFRSAATSKISEIVSRRSLPVIAGGSNSFVYALLAQNYNPKIDVFKSNSMFCRELQFNCCFIYIDVSPESLNQYLEKRVDDMFDSGMFEELGEYMVDPDRRRSERGLNMAIGVPEFRRYFDMFQGNWRIDNEVKRIEYEEAVKAIKDNSCRLAARQRAKILLLCTAAGWDVKRVDGTAAMKAKLDGKGTAEVWERQVVEPSVEIVKQFLLE